MNHLVYDTFLNPEVLENGNFSALSRRANILYNDWILKLKKGNTFFGLNWNWPSANLSPQQLTDLANSNYDTYVFSWHVEDWDHAWLKNFCEQHKNSQIVVISEFPLTDQYYNLPNLRCLVYHGWSMVIDEVLTYQQPQYVPPTKRLYRVSSLVNKPSYFKSLTTAYLLGTKKESLILSWNINQRKEICGSLDFLKPEIMPNPLLRKLAEYYNNELTSKTIKLDNFVDSRLSNYYANIPAYTDALVNITNETYSQTYVYRVHRPGPFITDKTWKPLISGCAMLPQGPANIYSYLERLGFQFEYPWDKSFDQLIGDIDRYMKFLTTVEQVFNLEFNQLARLIEPSCEYNYYYIRSAQFKKHIQQLNQQSIDEFMLTY